MPLSMTAKAALCLCPPAVMAGTVATVPAAKRAVHHLTAPRHLPHHVRPVAAHSAARPDVRTREQVNCDPVAPLALPAVPIVTYADPIPAEPDGATSGGGGGGGSASGLPGAVGVLSTGGGGVAPLTSPSPTPTPGVTPVITGAVPEPATWLMMIGGIGALGLALRRRRGDARERGAAHIGRATIGAGLWSGGAMADAGEMAATAAVKSTLAAKTTAAGVAGKALLCVCPAAVVAGSVMTVPALRQAVHASTAPAVAPIQARRPCGLMTVPVSAAAVNGFPASIETVPERAQ